MSIEKPKKDSYSILSYFTAVSVPTLIALGITDQQLEWYWWIRPALYLYIIIYIYEAIALDRALNADGFFKFFIGLQLMHVVGTTYKGWYFTLFAHLISLTFLIASWRISTLYNKDDPEYIRNMFTLWGLKYKFKRSK